MTAANSSASLQIRAITTAEIDAFYASTKDGPEYVSVRPVSETRARAFARNPKADPDDVCYLVAYLGGQCVGYLGLLIGALEHRGVRTKTACLSPWFVAPEARASGAGPMLLLRALAMKIPLYVPECSEQAAKVFLGVRFKALTSYEHPEIHIDRSASTGPGRLLARLGVIRRAWPGRQADTGLTDAESAFYTHAAIALYRTGRHIDLRAIEHLPINLPTRGETGDAATHFCRDVDDVNGMLDYPWVATKAAEATPNFHFCDLDPYFAYYAYEVRDKRSSQTRGYVVMRTDSRRGRRNLSLYDYYLVDDDAEASALLLWIVVWQARRCRPAVIRLPGSLLAACSRYPVFGQCFQPFSRKGYLHPAGHRLLDQQFFDELVLSMSDGDMPYA